MTDFVRVEVKEGLRLQVTSGPVLALKSAVPGLLPIEFESDRAVEWRRSLIATLPERTSRAGASPEGLLSSSCRLVSRAGSGNGP